MLETTDDTLNNNVANKQAERSQMGRSADLVKLLGKYGGPPLIEKLGLGRWWSSKDHDETAQAKDLAADLEALGPTYVKFGQLLSTRADLLPETYLTALSRLQDQVTPIPFADIKKIIESELKTEIRNVFVSFEEVPIGSASLAQVHRAILQNGRLVVVKVQRPKALEIVKGDMQMLKKLAHFIETHTEFGHNARLTEIHDQFDKAIMRELDFELEAQNLLRLSKNLEKFDQIIIPRPVEQLTTSKVLTMDYIVGTKLSQIGKLGRLEVDGTDLSETLLKAYLKQVFIDGFFHADPHPGNIFIMDQKHLALIDLGLVGHLPPLLRRRLLQMLPLIYNMDVEGLIDIAIDMGEQREDFDEHLLRTRFTDILENAQASNIEKIGADKVLFDIVSTSLEAGLRMPPEVSLIGRALFYLEDVGKRLAPNFNVNAAIQKEITHLVRKHIFQDLSPRSLLKTLLDGREFIRVLPRRVHQLLETLTTKNFTMTVQVVPEEHLIRSLQKIANRITTGLILAALIVGAAMLMQVETDFQLMGYPGFAIICFCGAALGGVWLLLSIWFSDRRKNANLNQKTRSPH